MPDRFFSSSTPAFTSRKRKTHIPLVPLKAKAFKTWPDKQPKATQAQIEQAGFTAKAGQCLPVIGKDGAVVQILVGINDPVGYFDFAHAVCAIRKVFAKTLLQQTSFGLEDKHGLSAEELARAHVGWGWGCYAFERCKTAQTVFPAMLWSRDVNRKAVLSMVESVNALRDLVNMPANLMGPEEIEKAAKALASIHDARVKTIRDEDLLKKNFPLIYTVGQASPRRPRLIEMDWGQPKHPKLVLIGKGVAFDTGGLDIKPSQYMRLMKKDMGGAAHVLALAKLLMNHELPVRLKVLIPAVENAVGGAAFRPGDIIKSRKGLFVENTNTDAEGRLVLADALAYACEGRKPDLVVDFATLTGSARAGLGPDIPAFFSNREKTHAQIRKCAAAEEDPVWPMPLWQPYRTHIENAEGDLLNSASVPGDGIYSALFLESFVEKDVDWMHLDVFSWEQTGKPGRPKGAADTGLRTMFRYLKERYGG